MEKTTTAKAVSSVMIIMVLSRLMSLLANQIYLAHYGAEGFINIYAYAISIPNTIFNCFGTALATVVVPVFAGLLATKKQDQAFKFADNIISISTIFTVLLIVIGIIISPALVSLTSYAKIPTQNDFAVKALMIMMPSMLFAGLNYIFQGMLQSMGRYKMPAFVSVPSSLVVIGYVLFVSDKLPNDKQISGLLWATLIGLFTQAAILMPPLLKTGYRFKPTISFKDEAIVGAGKMMLPVFVGVSAYQLNMFFNTTLMARFENMNALLANAQNLVMYMVMAIIFSITAVVYPKLTSFAAMGDMDGYKSILNTVIGNVLVLMVPATVGFIVVRKELLDVLMNYGQITDTNIKVAASFLLMYSISIVAISLKEILDRAFYSIKDTKTSAICGIIMVVINVVLGLLLIKPLGAIGVPLAYSVAAIVCCAALMMFLRRKIGSYGKGILVIFIKCAFSAFVMGVVVLIINKYMPNVGAGFVNRIIRLVVPTVFGAIIYFVCIFLLKVKSVSEFLGRKSN